MRALIDPRSGRVCELRAVDFPVAPPLHWIDAPVDITTSHTFDGATFLAPPIPPAPPTPAEEAAQQLRGQKSTLGIVRLLARRFNMTEQQVIDAIKAEFP